jgi:hypothetical protein
MARRSTWPRFRTFQASFATGLLVTGTGGKINNYLNIWRIGKSSRLRSRPAPTLVDAGDAAERCRRVSQKVIWSEERHKHGLGKGLQPFAIVMGTLTGPPARKTLTPRAERAAPGWAHDGGTIALRLPSSRLTRIAPSPLPEDACFKFRTDYRFSSRGHFAIANCCRLD